MLSERFETGFPAVRLIRAILSFLAEITPARGGVNKSTISKTTGRLRAARVRQGDEHFDEPKRKRRVGYKRVAVFHSANSFDTRPSVVTSYYSVVVCFARPAGNRAFRRTKATYLFSVGPTASPAVNVPRIVRARLSGSVAATGRRG